MGAVVFSAHIDDAVFSCYGVLGPDTTVVTVLAGVPAAGVVGDWDVEGGDERLGGPRARASGGGPAGVRALRLPGRAPRLRRLPVLRAAGSRDADRGGDRGGAARPRRRGRGGLRAAGIFNLDHKLVRDAVLSVDPEATLYADIPYALHPDMGGFELPPELSPARRQRHEVRLVAELVAAKIESALCYATQLAQLTSMYGPSLDEAGLSREVFWTPAAAESASGGRPFRSRGARRGGRASRPRWRGGT